MAYAPWVFNAPDVVVFLPNFAPKQAMTTGWACIPVQNQSIQRCPQGLWATLDAVAFFWPFDLDCVRERAFWPAHQATQDPPQRKPEIQQKVHDPLTEAQMAAERFRQLGLKEGERLVVLPRKAKVFLET